MRVYVFDGATYPSFNGTTDGNGEVTFTLPEGSYRFRADHNGTQFWSDAQNHCTIPGCEAVTIVSGAAPTPTPTPTSMPEPTPTQGAYSGGQGVLAMRRFMPWNAPLLSPDPVTVTVTDTDGVPQEGMPVYAFDGTSYTGVHGTADLNGEVVLDLPDGSYRFRSDRNGTQFWSGETNHCTVPGCASASVTVTIPVTITVEDTDGLPKEGLPVYAFSGGTYTGFNGTTDVNGEVQLTLPLGDYGFRSDLNATQFWSGETDHCAIPGCLNATVVVTLPVTVTVTDTDLVPQEGLLVYAFDGATYTGFNGTTDANGEAVFTLPQGEYRFRSDRNGTQFWSGEANHCTLPGCTTATVTVTIPIVVTVQSQTGSPYPDLPVYAFDETTYTGFNGVSDADGQVVFTLPEGSYHFRADYDGVQFWSGETNHCTIPGCLEALVEIPGGVGEVNVTIEYAYDLLYRLTAAGYDTGEYFHYTYDAVGNRLTQETHESNNSYLYDNANRLVEVDGVTFLWDDNGNLLQDDLRTYLYNHHYELVQVQTAGDTITFTYNGLGEILSQIENGTYSPYTVDLVGSLTQKLVDGSTNYIYGRSRIAQNSEGNDYYLLDVKGSVRQLIDETGVVLSAQNYDPFGVFHSSTQQSLDAYGYIGEWTDATGLIYLRARHYSPALGRFLTSDPARLEPNLYWYGASNPIKLSDPTGLFPGILGPWNFSICFGLHTVWTGQYHFMSAGAAVEICRTAFRQDTWGAINFDLTGDLPESAHDLFGWFLFEAGNKNWLQFSGDDSLTQELAKSTLINDVRTWYYLGNSTKTMPTYHGGDTSGVIFYPFDAIEFFGSGVFDLRNSILKGSLPIAFFLGSFKFQVLQVDGNRLGYRIDNDTTLESGTHIRGRFPGLFNGSVEEIIDAPGNEHLAFRPLSEIVDTEFNNHLPISILKPRLRSQTTSPQGGGSLYQTFTWTENFDPCLAGTLPWDVYGFMLDIGVWPGYEFVTQHPGEPFPK